jgi:hypothetical protein
MRPLRIGPQLTLVAALSVVAVFFFSPSEGPYSTVHGPVTALQSSRAARKLSATFAYAARYAMPERAFAFLIDSGVTLPDTAIYSAGPAEGMWPLRC